MKAFGPNDLTFDQSPNPPDGTGGMLNQQGQQQFGRLPHAVQESHAPTHITVPSAGQGHPTEGVRTSSEELPC